MVYTVQQIKEAVFPVFIKNNIKKAVLFGSYGKGNATEKSDIDILVDSGLRGLSFVGFLDELQTVAGKNTDLFDVTHIESGSRIDEEIKATGVIIYEK